MNREDPPGNQGQYRAIYQNWRPNNRGGIPGHYKSHRYDQGHPGSWVDNQLRNPLFLRSSGPGGRHKNTGGWNKTRRPFVHCPTYKAIAQQVKSVSPPKSPQPGSEEFLRRQSGALLRQMEECPDGEFVLPPITNAADSHAKEDTNEKVLPGIRYLRAEAESTAAELASNKRKRTAQQAHLKSAHEIANQLRQLKRQERVKVCRVIREMHNQANPQCQAANAVIPELSVKVEALPPEFRNMILDIVDIEPHPGDLASGIAQPDWNNEESENSNSQPDGEAPYNPFEADNYDSSSQEQYNWLAAQQARPQPQPMQEYQENKCDLRKSFDRYEYERRNSAVKAPEFIRSVKCQIKPGRADSRAPPKIKLKREPIDHAFNLMQIPPPPPSYSLHPGIPPHMNRFHPQNMCFPIPPPPIVIGPQIPQVPHTHSYNNRAIRQSEAHKITVIKEANETYNHRDHDAPSRNPRLGHVGDTFQIERPAQFDDNSSEANGFHNVDDDVLFRASYDIKGSDDDWNRNIIVKTKTRVLKEMALENKSHVDAMHAIEREPVLRSKFVRTITRNLLNGKDPQDIISNKPKDQADGMPSEGQQLQCSEEELDFEPSDSELQADDENNKSRSEEVLQGEVASVPSVEELPSDELASIPSVEELQRDESASIPSVDEVTCEFKELESPRSVSDQQQDESVSMPSVEEVPYELKELESIQSISDQQQDESVSMPSVEELPCDLEESASVQSAEEVAPEPVPEVVVVGNKDAAAPEPQTGGVKLKADCNSVIVLEATSQPGTYKAAKKGKLVTEHMYCKNVASAEDSTEETDKIKFLRTLQLSEGIQTDDIPVENAKDCEKEPASLPSKPENTHSSSHRSDHKRTHSKSKSSYASKHSKSSHSSKSKTSSSRSDRPSDRHSSSGHKRDYHDKKTKPKEVKTKNRDMQTEPESTDIGKLRARYNRLRQNTRQLLSRLNVIDKKVEDLLSERREVCKVLIELAATSESEDDKPSAAVKHPRRRASEAGQPPAPTRPENAKRDKEVPTKYYYIRGDGLTTPSTKNPVLNSDPPSEQVLTKVLHSEDHLNPESPPDFLMHSMDDIDIFSMISEPQGKAAFNEPAEKEIPEESYTVDSNPLSQTEETDMDIDAELGGVMKTTETMPADILEPSDNECVGDSPLKSHANNLPFVKLIKYNVEDLQRLKQDLAQKGIDEFVPHGNNNVKIEETDMGGSEADVISEFFGNEVNVDTEEENVVDFVGWKDSILVIKVIKDKIVAGNNKGKLYYFDTQSAYPSFSQTLSPQPITSMVVLENDQFTRLFIGSLDGNLYIYDVVEKRQLKIAKFGVPIQCLEMGWTGIYMGSARGDLIKYCLLNGRMSSPVNISEEAVLAIKCTVEGARRVLVVATRNSPIAIRDASTGLALRTIGGSRCSTVYSLVLHNNRIYSGTSHDDVLAFNFHDGRLLFKHSESGGSGIVCMTTVRDLLFVASYNGFIYVYNTTDNTFITSLSAPPGLLLCMDVTNTHLIAGTKQNFQCMLLPASVSSLL